MKQETLLEPREGLLRMHRLSRPEAADAADRAGIEDDGAPGKQPAQRGGGQRLVALVVEAEETTAIGFP